MTISTPSLRALERRCGLVPSLPPRDRINPSRLYTALYAEEGLWENRISRTATASASALRDEQTGAAPTPHASFDACCAAEVEKRYPDGVKVTGIKGIIERILHAFLRVFGRRFTAFTDSERAQLKKQISYSACNRLDLRSKITIQDPDLKLALQVSEDNPLVTTHTFSKNSSLNGQSFLNEKGETVSLTSAICSSNDRNAEQVGNLRRVATKNNTSIAYAGRAESLSKAEELASFIFFSELRAHKQGITSSVSDSGETTFEMDYIVSSALSTHPIMSFETIGVPFAEKAALINEVTALKVLNERGYIQLTDPEDGQTYKVRFKPILFSDSLNFLLKTEESFPPELSGASISSEVNQRGLSQLASLVEKKQAELRALRETATDTTNPSLAEINKKISALQKTYELCLLNKKVLPEEKLLLRDYLFKLLELPVTYHCKSSTDRTGIMIALSSALQQWIDLKLELPEPLTGLLADFRFKELFAANLFTGHQITRYARSTHGIVNGKNSCDHILGYSFSSGLFQNPLIQRLMPERYLTDYPLHLKILMGSAIFTLHFLSIPLLALQTIWHLGRWIAKGCKKDQLSSWKFLFPFSIVQSLIASLNFVPQKVLNNASPQVGGRSFLSKLPQKCPHFASDCLQTAGVQENSAEPFQTATTSAEYKKALSDFKKNVKTGYAERRTASSPELSARIQTLIERHEQDPLYDYAEELAAIKQLSFGSVQRDMERTRLHGKSRTLLINGKKYGFSSDDEHIRTEECHAQILEIYEKLKAFYLQASPELAGSDRQLELEAKVLFAMDQLHQGALQPLLSALVDQFESMQFFLSTNNSYHLEMQLDPEEILEDGTKGSILLNRRFIMETASFDTIAARGESTQRTTEVNHPLPTNEYGMNVYQNKRLQPEGLVYAECLEEVRPGQSLSIRFGVL